MMSHADLTVYSGSTRQAKDSKCSLNVELDVAVAWNHRYFQDQKVNSNKKTNV